MPKYPPTFSMRAIEADALSDPNDLASCQLVLTVESGDVHIVGLKREVLRRLHRRIGDILSESPTLSQP